MAQDFLIHNGGKPSFFAEDIKVEIKNLFK